MTIQTFINICSLCGGYKVGILIICVKNCYGNITGARLLRSTPVSGLDLETN